MTFIQAQHVIGADGRAAGVNVFTFAFLDRLDIDAAPSAVMERAVAARKRLMFAIREVESAHLRVLSFLDVAARAGQSRPALAAAVQAAVARWPGEQGDWKTEDVVMRLHAAAGIDGPHLAIELRRLVVAIRRTLGSQDVPAGRALVAPPSPLTIVCTRAATGLRFELQPGSLRALRLALPPEHVVSRSAFVPLETYDAYEYFAMSQIEGEIATSLTGLTHQQLDALCGGALVVDGDGTPRWRSPALELAARG